MNLLQKAFGTFIAFLLLNAKVAIAISSDAKPSDDQCQISQYCVLSLGTGGHNVYHVFHNSLF